MRDLLGPSGAIDEKESAMGYGYPVELRKRVVSAVKRGLGTREEVADMFEIGVATVGRWIRADRERGMLTPKPHGGGNSRRLDEDDVRLLVSLVEKRNDSTIEELRVAMEAQTGKTISHSTIARELKRAGLTRKKKTSAPPNR